MKIFFIINGGRATVPASLVKRLRAILDEAGACYRLEVSRTLEQANDFVAQAAAGDFDTLWMGGGDGTIHVLLNESMPTHLTLGVVPMGTVNALARALGIPLQPEQAVRFLLKATPRSMNIGCVNDERRFLCFAGVGIDAAVVHDVGGKFKRYCGRLAYAAAGAASVFALGRIAPFRLSFDADDRLPLPGDDLPAAVGAGANDTPTAWRRTDKNAHPEDCDDKAHEGLTPPSDDRGYSLVLSNIKNYAGFNLFPDAHPCAEAMEMWVFRHRRLDAMALWTAATFVGWKRWQRAMRGNVGHYLVRGFTVESAEPLYLQLDGEAIKLGDGRYYHFEFCQEAVMVLA